MPDCSKVITAAQMRAIESEAMASGRITAFDLMCRAGEAVVAAILARWPKLRDHRPHDPHAATVLCGPGNNGGDGFVIARLLAGRGWRVRVLFRGDRARLSPEAALAHDQWQSMGPVEPLPLTCDPVIMSDLLVDALFGTGLTRPLDPFEEFLSYAGDALASTGRGARHAPGADHVVAVDVPSGLCADSGRVLGRPDLVLAADLTVTFEALKPGHLLARGPDLCGEVVCPTIGLARELGMLRTDLHRLTAQDLAVAAPFLRKSGGHKFSHGHALIIAGGPGHGGAARLAARAALRIGAGLVTICPPAGGMAEHAGPPDALMRRPIEDARDLAAALADARVTAVCLGPGCGVARAASLLPAVLERGGPCLLDADALTALAGRPDLVARLHEGCVLTPHDGEFARLFPDIAARLAAAPDRGPAFSRLDAARAAQEASGATILLKGPDSVIATAATAHIHSRQDLGALATAGSGDVLAGIVTGLLARGAPPDRAPRLGVLLHAGAAALHGPGLIADDLPELVVQMLRPPAL
ncbi:MAG: NAD(P)H-hydrate dehydratase [Paracoccus sp. (in: a-proteobacteria)]|uniref:NAD(P)H-hydrate dehydratase n=1 Tax=Paracoccus sp. TaxID=267 RepID=UPI003918FE06